MWSRQRRRNGRRRSLKARAHIGNYGSKRSGALWDWFVRLPPGDNRSWARDQKKHGHITAPSRVSNVPFRS